MDVTKAEIQALHQDIARAKSYSDLKHLMGDSSGEDDFKAIVKSLHDNPPRDHRMIINLEPHGLSPELQDSAPMVTPEGTQNPEPPGSGAPFLPHDFGRALPLPNRDATTPTPGGSPSLAAM